MDNIVLCKPKEFVNSEGICYVEKIPGHYVVFIPNSVQRQDVINRITKPVNPSKNKKKPHNPNRVHNSFILYRMEKTKEIKRQNPTINQTVVSRMCAQMWRNEKAEIKRKYKAKSDLLKIKSQHEASIKDSSDSESICIKLEVKPEEQKHTPEPALQSIYQDPPHATQQDTLHNITAQNQSFDVSLHDMVPVITHLNSEIQFELEKSMERLDRATKVPYPQGLPVIGFDSDLVIPGSEEDITGSTKLENKDKNNLNTKAKPLTTTPTYDPLGFSSGNYSAPNNLPPAITSLGSQNYSSFLPLNLDPPGLMELENIKLQQFKNSTCGRHRRSVSKPEMLNFTEQLYKPGSSHHHFDLFSNLKFDWDFAKNPFSSKSSLFNDAHRPNLEDQTFDPLNFLDTSEPLGFLKNSFVTGSSSLKPDLQLASLPDTVLYSDLPNIGSCTTSNIGTNTEKYTTGATSTLNPSELLAETFKAKLNKTDLAALQSGNGQNLYDILNINSSPLSKDIFDFQG
ncbi:hypothetical protein BB560_000550 [Smittium megazygosporum]|uniref:HMG box domain-containing protein n=1 Tax=Smittium megazygosporum TaxID=133381 RepID=A0A2T9ZK16_9FUNG|nr:hypothetical protein BB560_006856 [Smittium megazygosporum]PVV04934.1 hypothetical protein BB560_000550 [Smittium megazygosporum]